VSLNEVLRDRDAYILFYAREDPTTTQKQTVPNDSTLKSPLHVSKPNGINGNTSTSGKKRPLQDPDDEPSKRRRLSDDEDDEDSDREVGKPNALAEQKPTKSVNNGNLDTKLSNPQRIYSKTSISSITSPPNSTLMSNASHRPYGPKQLPIPRIDKSQQSPQQRPEVKRGAQSQFFRDLQSKNDAQHRPLSSQSLSEKQIPKKNGLKQSISRQQQHPQAPRHRLSQYDYSNTSPLDNPDAEPFANGYQQSARNRNQGKSGRPQLRFPGGVSSAIQPGETSSFMKDVDGKKGPFSTSDGIKIRRNK
jgi:hypothetical protein